MIEKWKAIPDFKGYEASNIGRIQSYRSRHGIEKNPHILKPNINRDGYFRLCLMCDGVRTRIFVHRLVLKAFIGCCPKGYQGCHNDGNPANNHIDNLRWDTPKNNAADRFKHGTDFIGERNPGAKLKEIDLPNIRLLSLAGIPKDVIGEKYGVTRATIWSVLTGVNWKKKNKIKQDCIKSNQEAEYTQKFDK